MSYGFDDLLPHLGDGYKVVGDASAISFRYPAPASEAEPDAIVWIRSTRPDAADLLRRTAAGVVICGQDVAPADGIPGKCLLVVDNPKVVYSRVVAALFEPKRAWGIHPTAIIDYAASIEEPVFIGPYTVIGRASIGAGTVIFGQVYIYDGVRIGRNVRIHAGCVIGGDGFGFEPNETGHLEKFPHVGGVVIEDDVEIQAQSAIDRGTLGDTIVHRGAKFDNFVHVAHNCEIGEDALVTAQCMLAGGVKVGKRCWLGPGSVFRDNITIGDGAFIGIGSLVVKDVEAGTTQMGSPARPADEYKAQLAALRAAASAASRREQ